jgi:hypothetical protein
MEQPTVRPAADPKEKLAEREPWLPPAYPPALIGALKALSRGTAESHQQVLAVQHLIDLCHNGGAHFFPGEDGRRNTDFALGRAWVGQQIVTMIKWIVQPGGEQG